jgi:hypothetical protein
MLMTDADLCARLRLTAAERWQAVLQHADATWRHLRGVSPFGVKEPGFSGI